ncbi:putative RING-H2 finger protein ATL71 [Juglans microcarpa x Juglans regia]|uniref:putative RING-H2 finger protein ATL71 n=1 Tax=Juglans microcarpa x Juglans regia TaxID=2249226 RepID=UPI001B7DD999|nr:putative RING-H2 finger protein ATL71 [Juglans microcarpa x Juglans regia]
MGLAAGNPSTHQTITIPNSDRNFAAIELGLDEVSLQSFPKLLYSQYKLQKHSSTASCCSICLMDYKETDVLQLLPDCGHLFHLKCINPWLRLHPTCPMCRNSAVSIPSAVRPPIELPAPLATQQE